MKGISCLFSLIYLVCSYILFGTANVYHANSPTILIVCIISFFCVGVLWMPSAWVHTEKYRKKKFILPILIISLYSSLASFGYNLLSFNDPRISMDIVDVAYVLLGTFWFVYIIFTVLYLLEYFSSIVAASKPNTSNRKYSYLFLFALLCIVQVILAISFMPGGFPNDTVWLLPQAAGHQTISDWHPVFYTLTLRFLLTIIPNESVFEFVQMILFAWLVTDFLMIGFDRGMPLHFISIAGICFLLLPNQVFSGIGIVKDYPFTLSLLWGTLLLVKLSLKPELYRNVFFLTQLFVDQFFILAYRHNGIIPVLFIALACLIVGLNSEKMRKLIVLIPSICALAAFFYFKGPVFEKLQVYPNTSSPYVTMICAVGSVVNKDLPLSEEANAILEEVMPLEDWGAYYSRFEGHDRYVWGRGSEVFDTSSITLSKAFRIYLEALFKYPDVVFKDRLDGMNILWCVAQPVDSFNTRYFDSVYRFDFTDEYIDISNLESEESDWIGYINRSGIAEFYRNHDGSDISGIWDMLFWRGGVYVILLLICTVFWTANKMRHMLLPFIPLLGNLFGSVLLVYHQSFRYIYFLQLMVVALAFVSVLTRNDSKQES